MTGFHSVIDRPERVSRVIPPTTTISKDQRAAEKQPRRDRAVLRFLSVAVAAPDRPAIVEKDTRHSHENNRLRAR